MRKLLSVLIAVPAISIAGDISTTPWQMYQQNPSHTAYVDASIAPESLKYSWKVPVGNNVNGTDTYFSQPMVAGELVYVTRSNEVNDPYAFSGDAKNGSLQAFSITDGHEVWRKDFAKGIVNPPAVVNGMVYMQDENYGKESEGIYGFDAKTGTQLFKVPSGSQWSHEFSPTIFDGKIYESSGFFQAFYAYDAITGATNWVKDIPQGTLWSPAVTAQYAITYSGKQLQVLDRLSGQLLASIQNPHDEDNYFYSGNAPVMISENDVLVIKSGYLTSFNIKNKNTNWSVGSGYGGHPAFDGTTIYVQRNHGLYAVDTTGKVLWTWFQDNENVSDEVLVTQNLVFVSTNKQTYAISKATHDVVWSYPAGGKLSLGMGHLYILDNSHNLIAISVSNSK